MSNLPSKRYRAGSKRSVYAALSELHGIGIAAFAEWDKRGELETKLQIMTLAKMMGVKSVPKPRKAKS